MSKLRDFMPTKVTIKFTHTDVKKTAYFCIRFFSDTLGIIKKSVPLQKF